MFVFISGHLHVSRSSQVPLIAGGTAHLVRVFNFIGSVWGGSATLYLFHSVRAMHPSCQYIHIYYSLPCPQTHRADIKFFYFYVCFKWLLSFLVLDCRPGQQHRLVSLNHRDRVSVWLPTCHAARVAGERPTPSPPELKMGHFLNVIIWPNPTSPA